MLTNTQTIVESVGGSGATVGVVAAVRFVAWIYAIVWAVRQERAARVREAAEARREELVPLGA